MPGSTPLTYRTETDSTTDSVNGGMGGMGRTFLSSSPCWTWEFNLSMAAAIPDDRILCGFFVAEELSAPIHQNQQTDRLKGQNKESGGCRRTEVE